MDKHLRWLLVEIERWKAEGLVTPEQAEQLCRRYPDPGEARPWGLIIFVLAGAIVIGLGVILLFAYNWEDIPRFGKLGLIFAAVLAAHLGGLRWNRSAGWKKGMAAVLHLLGTMFYGSGIWLIAQIYHIDEHFPDGFLLWGLGALLLAWPLASVTQGLLATALLTIWGCAEVVSFREPQILALPLILAGVLPLAWRQRSGVLLCALVLAAYCLLLVSQSQFGGGAHAFTTAFALGAFCVASARLLEGRGDFPGGARVLNFFGYAGFIVCSYLLSFRWFEGKVFRGTAGDAHALVYTWISFGLAIAAWALVTVRVFRRTGVRVPGEEWLVPVALAYCYLNAWGHLADLPALGPRPFNLILLGVAAGWMWRGTHEDRLRDTVLGLLLLSLVVLARYFDLFQSLAARGLAFVVLGIALISVVFFHRRKPNPDEPRGGAA